MLLLLRKNDDFFVDKVLQLVRKELTCDIIEVNESSNIYRQFNIEVQFVKSVNYTFEQSL